MNESDVINKYNEWASIRPSDELLNRAVSFLKGQKDHLEKEWIGKEGDAAYVQTYEKIASYLNVLTCAKVDQSIAKEKMLEVEKRVVGLFQNWRDTPNDKCIPRY